MKKIFKRLKNKRLEKIRNKNGKNELKKKSKRRKWVFFSFIFFTLFILFSPFFLKFFSYSHFLNSFQTSKYDKKNQKIQKNQIAVENQKQKAFDPSHRCERIVSLAPNLTEILFILGLGEKLKAVTRFCNYPEAAKKKKKIGGFLDLNLEALLVENPSVIFALKSHKIHQKKLKRLNWFILNIQSIKDILKAIESIGIYCGLKERAFSVTHQMRKKIEGIKKKINHKIELKKEKKRPRVLLTLGSSMNYSFKKGIYAAGKGSFYDDMIFLLGGENAISKKGVQYPRLSLESLIDLDPDILIELVDEKENTTGKNRNSKPLLNLLQSVKAYKNQQVYKLKNDFAFIPGPRSVLLLEQLAHRIETAFSREKTKKKENNKKEKKKKEKTKKENKELH